MKAQNVHLATQKRKKVTVEKSTGERLRVDCPF